MRAHLTKNEFKFVSVTVMVLEVAAFLVFIFGTLGAILGTIKLEQPISTTDFILLGFGGIFIALMLMAMAEILQLVMRIEYNTRKENTLLMKQTQVQLAEVKATKSVASLLRKKPARRAVRKTTPKKAVIKKSVVRKPMAKKMKPRKRK